MKFELAAEGITLTFVKNAYYSYIIHAAAFMQNLPTISIKSSLQKWIDNYSGLLIALTIMVLWLVSLIFLFSINIVTLSIPFIIFAVVVRTFLQTGMFITAHDAIHGSIFPKNRTINHLIGSVAVTLYALLSYNKLSEKHWQHHRFPSSPDDPDFYDGDHRNVLGWFLKFMRGYLDTKQNWILLVGMSLIFYTLHLVLQIPTSNLLLFWVLPILFSSMQLFYFGVFLPHRRPARGYRDRHRAISSNYSPLWSFITCYHFGYHWEHHEYPHLSWYQLPKAHSDLSKAISRSAIAKAKTIKLFSTSSAN